MVKRILLAAVAGFCGLAAIVVLVALLSPSPAPEAAPAPAEKRSSPSDEAAMLCLLWARENAPGASWRGAMGLKVQVMRNSHIQVAIQGSAGNQPLRATCQVSLDGTRMSFAVIRKADTITLEPYGESIASFLAPE